LLGIPPEVQFPANFIRGWRWRAAFLGEVKAVRRTALLHVFLQQLRDDLITLGDR
jgi:hypothetical protein